MTLACDIDEDRTMQRLKDRVAVITGAARGIGRGIALCMAIEGADIVLNDLPPDAPGVVDARATAADIEAIGRRALVVYGDVADRDAVDQVFAAAIEQFGRVDIAVANAAFSIRELVVEAQWEHVLRTIEVTQFGVFHTCQAAARHMVARGGPGKIIIIGSILAQIPLPTSAAYNMAKAAVNHLASTMAAELAPYRINVNVINPGHIDTPGERKFATEEELQRAAQQIPWGRMGTPHDIGRAAVFLASDDADYITGSAICVDGGYRVGMRLYG
jgi:glucose 1-dehydrogenase